ncbi:MAG: hypothetical protein GF308_00355 [Candidatus Heimdallarchaeota archaeon]|nr:hypothetical protein [Candidatus Heimdallarchaeota archaeon]
MRDLYMIQKRAQKKKPFTRFSKMVILILVLILIPIFINQKIPMNNVRAHSDYAWPTEIFSLWNDTNPVLDGQIEFSTQDVSAEWSGASINLIFDYQYQVSGVLLLQNDDDSLYVAMDMIYQQEESPPTTWGCAIYFDSNHDGYLTSFIHDRALFILTNHNSETDTIVYWTGYDAPSENWVIEESDSTGTTLPSGIFADTAFAGSIFNETAHRQFELKIPFDAINSFSGDMMGIGFESFEDFDDYTNDAVTWPYIGFTPARIRFESWQWGDIYFGEGESTNPNVYPDYVIEKNTRIKYDAIGPNNGTFFTTGDINGDGDLELIVSSNRTAATSEGIQPLVSIFDYQEESFRRIWSSWRSSLPPIPFFLKQIVAYDFNGDGQDELYACGQNKRVLRMYNWNDTSDDFESREVAFTHINGLMGYITIGDVDNDGEQEILCGDQNGKIIILKYDSANDNFFHDLYSPLTPPQIGTSVPYRIHALEVEDMDQDGKNELLIQSQTTADDDSSLTQLQVLEKDDISSSGYVDNPEDDLPGSSSVTTEDHFGHTIVVEDVDSDGIKETVTAGKNYLRIFEYDSFSEPQKIREFNINSSQNDLITMGGGAVIADPDNDGDNELIFGCSNGSLMVITVPSYEYDNYITEWKGDVGSSPGKREAIVVMDVDKDSKNEIIVGDNFGQILVLGKSKPPIVTITSPISGSIVGQNLILLEWDIEEDHISMHHYDIFVNDELVGRTGGAQFGYMVSIDEGINTIEIIGYDITGQTDYDSVEVEYEPGIPEVDILSPENNFETKNDIVTIEYEGYDPDGLIDHYEIWRNSSLIEASTTEEFYDISLPESAVWNITVVIVDTEGKKSRDMIYIILDLDEPTIEITYPSEGEALSSTEIEFEWFATDALSGIDYFEIHRNGEFYGSTTENSYIISLNLDQEYLLSVKAFDEVGNSAVAETTIIRDTKTPVISILSPEDEYISIDSTITIAWNATDNPGGSGIDFSEVTVNGKVKYSGSNNNTDIDLGDVEGSKNIAVTTFDEAGNTATDYLSVILDNSDPTISIISPDDNFTTGLSYVLVSWESYDAGTGIKEYQVFVNDIPKTIITDPEETFYQASIPNNDSYKITIKSLDYLNNVAEDSIQVIHDPSTATLSIVDPEEITIYSNQSKINVSWEIYNIENIEKFEIYLNGTINNTIWSSNKTSALVDFGSVVTSHPINFTLSATTQDGKRYNDFRWITIDQALPEISLISPGDDALILDKTLAVEWIGSDVGSGIREYQILLGEEIIATTTGDKTSKVIDLGGYYDHEATLRVKALDRAGNAANDSASLSIYLYPPIFTTGKLTDSFTTNTGEFQFNLTITDPGLGVRKLDIFADDELVVSFSYEENIKTNPFWLLVNITEFSNVSSSSWHNITLSVTDISNREGFDRISIYIDHTSPSFINTIFDDKLLSLNELSLIEITEGELNNHNITVYVTDDSAVESISLTILGEELNQTYSLIFVEKLGVDYENATYVYALTLDLEEFELGDYTFVFTITDISANSYSGYYNVTLTEGEQLPWIMEGRNLLYVSLGGSLMFILIVVLFVTLRKPVANIGWREAILAVAYVTKTGTTCIYVPYSSELISDDQLFGGAMTGIRGVLQEITGGEETKRSVENVEVGNKTFLIYPGEFGEGVLLTNSVKPILKTNLIKFTDDFEEEFEKDLSEDLINLHEFALGKVMVESYFGIAPAAAAAQASVFEQMDADPMIIDQQSETSISPTHPSIDQQTSIPPKEATDESIDMMIEDQHHQEFSTISPETEALLAETIKATQEAIIALTENDFDMADGKAQTVVNSLEIILQSGESLEEIKTIIEKIPAIVQEIFKGIQYGRNGDIEKLVKSIEKASEKFGELS